MVPSENKRPAYLRTPGFRGYAPVSLRRAILLDSVVNLLIQKSKLHLYWAELYDHCRSLLKVLRMPSMTRSLAFQRLSNAEAYANCGEYEAAAFELRLLRNQLAD